ncbi:ankyrin repeat domain-containing protein 31 [Stigmatopora nigra]
MAPYGHLAGKAIKRMNRRNRFGETLLHGAVLKADIQLLKDTLKLGANVNRTDNTGRTALHEAAVRNQYEACCCLINAGASVNIESRNKATPLHEAIKFGNKRIVELLQKHKQQQSKAKEEQTTFGINVGPSCQVQEDVQNKESASSKQNQTEVPRGNPKTLTSGIYMHKYIPQASYFQPITA